MQMRFLSLILASIAAGSAARAAELSRTDLEQQFTRNVQPFLQTYCYECHGKDQPEAEMDLSAYRSMGTLVQDGQRWSQLMERLEAGEMPPKKAEKHPSTVERQQAMQ